MKKFFLIFVMLILTPTLFADEPLPQTESYRTFPQGKFYLQCDAEKNTTTCFEITENGDREKWTVQDFERFAKVSASGVFCILDHTEGLVPTDYNKDTVLFKVYKNGKLFDTLTVGKVYEKPIKLKLHKTASHYKWGYIQRFYEEGILLVTNEGERWYDFGKKKVMDTKKKLAEIAVKQRQEAFKNLERTFLDVKNLIADNEDREKLSLAVEKILSLYKNKKMVESPRKNFDLFEDGNIQLSIGYPDGGAFKGAFGHSVKTVFYFKDGKSYIKFFLCNDNCDLFIDIAGGGKRENVEGFGSLDSDYQPEQEPARFYEFNSKTKEVRTGDFYWE